MTNEKSVHDEVSVEDVEEVMQEKAVVKADPVALQMLSVDSVMQRHSIIEEVTQKVMKEGVHYGKPFAGSDKKVLLKGGAEKLKVVFQLSDECDVRVINHENGHREYRVTTKIYHYPSQTYLGHGEGSCSTLESKYRWRQSDRKCPNCQKTTIIKGKKEYGGGWLCWEKKGGCGSKWSDGDKAIEGQKLGWVENEDIADVYNTVLKMAKKRSVVDAVINVTGCSDLFTQDEDTPGYDGDNPETKEGKKHVTKSQYEKIVVLAESLPEKYRMALADSIGSMDFDRVEKVIYWLQRYSELSNIIDDKLDKEEVIPEKTLEFWENPSMSVNAREIKKMTGELLK